MAFPVNQLRNDFPILSTQVHGKPLVYFDNGATTQKPRQVIDRLVQYYETENSNVHRGAHHLSNLATVSFEGARNFIAQYINAQRTEEVIFTRGTTDSINLVASSFHSFIQKGDEVLITAMEHHSNLVPWQQLCKNKEAHLCVIQVLEDGMLDMPVARKMLSPKVKILAFTHISNVLGTINPVKELVAEAHRYNIPVLIDGAQAIAHVQVDVQELDCEFYAFSAHKAYGPMGTGVLYGKSEWLNKLPPCQFGGEMIDQVSFDKTVFNKLPYKFEAGTPNVADVLGMETALRYLDTLGIKNIQQYEDGLLEHATSSLLKIPGIKIIGRAKQKTAVISFIVEGIHPYDLGTLLDQMGIAVRTGNHCAQPLVESLGLNGTIRVSFGLYNTLSEVDYFIDSLKRAINMLL
ncbi:MAG: cysteine sulfinate desulfinase [Bacteroidetes bacterium GWF2_41_31]|nr:MAG: cysteine sulfinate desulfinase [Bacteroidetes bacterium GWF2_41_31]